MTKKISITFFIAILIITSILPCFADDLEVEEVNVDQIQEEIMQTATVPVKEPVINSKAAVVLDRESKRVLYSKNANEKRAMASTTKIMTGIVALENSKLEEEIVVSKNSARIGGSRLGLKAGDKITMNDLIYGLMLRSGNDAAAQIAETIGGGYEGFAELMNKKAKELGLSNTHFVTPHGLDDENHYTTAYELALLTDYALSNDKFSEIVGSKTKTILINGQQRELYNTNELLGNLNGINGVKTGFTNNAGRCLVTSCTRDNENLISVVLGADTKKNRTKDSIQIIEFAYATYSSINLKEKIKEHFENWVYENKIEVYKGKEEYILPQLEEIPYEHYLVKEGEQIEITIECQKYLEAPVQKDVKVGKMNITLNGEEILELDLVIQENVSRKEPMDYWKELWSTFKRSEVGVRKMKGRPLVASTSPTSFQRKIRNISFFA